MQSIVLREHLKKNESHKFRNRSQWVSFMEAKKEHWLLVANLFLLNSELWCNYWRTRTFLWYFMFWSNERFEYSYEQIISSEFNKRTVLLIRELLFTRTHSLLCHEEWFEIKRNNINQKSLYENLWPVEWNQLIRDLIGSNSTTWRELEREIDWDRQFYRQMRKLQIVSFEVRSNDQISFSKAEWNVNIDLRNADIEFNQLENEKYCNHN